MVIPHMGVFVNKSPHQKWGEGGVSPKGDIGGGLTKKGGVIYEQKYEGKLKHFTF